MRHRLFWDILGYSKTDLILYQGTVEDLYQPVQGHPRVYLIFTQDVNGVAVGGQKSVMQCCFRLMQYTQATYTPTLATALANEIKTVFHSSGAGLLFTKGKTIYKYYDKPNGYRLLIRGNDQESAVELIEKLLLLTNTPYDQNKLTVSTPVKSNTNNNPAPILVYGQELTPPVFRPVVNVRFRYAYVVVPGYPKNILLYDTTGLRKALVT